MFSSALYCIINVGYFFFFIIYFLGILEIRTVSEGGILAIKGVKSQFYISMNKAGQLQGKVIKFPEMKPTNLKVTDGMVTNQ